MFEDPHTVPDSENSEKIKITHFMSNKRFLSKNLRQYYLYDLITLMSRFYCLTSTNLALFIAKKPLFIAIGVILIFSEFSLSGTVCL